MNWSFVTENTWLSSFAWNSEILWKSVIEPDGRDPGSGHENDLEVQLFI